MFDDVISKILEPRERIKDIRKNTLRCTQSDLACSTLTREMISQIENKKKNLTWDAARSISDNMNSYAKEYNIMFNITATDLMKSETEQAHDKVISYTIDLKNLITAENSTEISMKIFDKVNDIMAHHEIEHSAVFDFYMTSIDLFQENSLLDKSKECILESFLISNSDRDNLNVLIKLTKIAYSISKYNDVIFIAESAIALYNKCNFNDIESLQDLYYNLALAYKSDNQYDKCYDIFDIVSNLKIPFLDLDILYANCLLEHEKYLEAEKRYSSILHTANFLNNAETIFRIYRNLAFLYYKIEKIDKSYEYINLAMATKCHKTKDELAFLYSFAFIVNLKTQCGNLKIRRSFDEAIEKCKNANDVIFQIKLFIKIIDYYMQHKYNEDILEIIDALEKNILNKHISNEKYFHVFNKAANYFLENNRPADANIIFQKMMNISSNYSESDLF